MLHLLGIWGEKVFVLTGMRRVSLHPLFGVPFLSHSDILLNSVLSSSLRLARMCSTSREFSNHSAGAGAVAEKENGPGYPVGMLVLDRILLSTGYIAVTGHEALSIGGGHKHRPPRLAGNALTR